MITYYLCAFLLGSIFGSFFHVVFSRRDWFKGRSRCDTCGYTLKWYDLIPIFSYIFLKGKCRKCRTNIRPTHFASEVLMGLTFVAVMASLMFFNNIQKYIIAFGLLCMGIAAIEDLIEHKVLNVILNLGVIAAWILKSYENYIFSGWVEVAYYTLEFAILKTMLWGLSKALKNKIGEGDFDILLLMYLMCGAYGSLMSVFFGSFIGCIIYMPLILLKKHDRKDEIPFVPLLLAGTIIYLLMQCIGI